MIRVVLDTNVIVSALLQPLGAPAAIFLLAASGVVQLCVSGNVYAEYEEVIRRPRLARDEEIITATLQTIRENGFWVKPTETIKACSDPDDDIFVSAGERGHQDGRLRDAPNGSFGPLRAHDSAGARKRGEVR